MADELVRSPALRFVFGCLALMLGAALHFLAPWQGGDGLGLACGVLSAVGIAVGLGLLAAGERVAATVGRILARLDRAAPALLLVPGAALLLAGMARSV